MPGQVNLMNLVISINSMSSQTTKTSIPDLINQLLSHILLRRRHWNHLYSDHHQEPVI